MLREGKKKKQKPTKLFCSTVHSGFCKEIRNLRNNSWIRSLIYRYLIKRFPRTHSLYLYLKLRYLQHFHGICMIKGAQERGGGRRRDKRGGFLCVAFLTGKITSVADYLVSRQLALERGTMRSAYVCGNPPRRPVGPVRKCKFFTNFLVLIVCLFVDCLLRRLSVRCRNYDAIYSFYFMFYDFFFFCSGI